MNTPNTYDVKTYLDKGYTLEQQTVTEESI